MNASTMTKSLADAIETDLATLDFKQTSPEAEVERLCNAHRNMVAKCEQRKADTRKNLKAALAGLDADKRAVKAQYEEDVSFLAQRIAEARDKAARDTDADRKLAEASKAALKALEA